MRSVFDACMYHDPRYGTIDLSSLGNTNGTSQFKDYTVAYMNNYLWSYNPCYNFSEMACENVAGCLSNYNLFLRNSTSLSSSTSVDQTNNISYTIGLQEYVQWTNVNASSTHIASIIYPAIAPDQHLVVQLICDQSTSSSPSFSVIGQTAVGEYTMQLSSHCACWDGCLNPKPDPSPDPSPFQLEILGNHWWCLSWNLSLLLYTHYLFVLF